MKIYRNIFERIVSAENLFTAWDAFKDDKQNRRDVQTFEWRLEQNIFSLYYDLRNKTYRHGPYKGFWIRDPKQRHIHKASVRDRVLHHAIFSIINPIFEETFIPNSFSCRVGFGTHKGIAVLEGMTRAVAQNGIRPCFVLKCDIKKFFDSVNHDILLEIFRKKIKDENAMGFLTEIVESYTTPTERERERERERVNTAPRKGIPIGNLTSQLFANVYINEFDQFVKHILHIKDYVRYTDDFAIASPSRAYLESLIEPISAFLHNRLGLALHPKKISIRKLHQGIDFLGYLIFPKHRLLRTKTRRRMFAKFKAKVAAYRTGALSEESLMASLQSYLGAMSHADAVQLAEEMKNLIWFVD